MNVLALYFLADFLQIKQLMFFARYYLIYLVMYSYLYTCVFRYSLEKKINSLICVIKNGIKIKQNTIKQLFTRKNLLEKTNFLLIFTNFY